MVRDAIVKMEKVRSEVSRNSDLTFAVNEYDKAKLDQFNDIYQGKNKMYKTYLDFGCKTKNSDYASVTTVTKYVAAIKSDHQKV